MDAITVLGVVSGFAGLFCVAVYVISIYKSDPQLILRMWDEDADGKQALIFGKETHLRFGISTKRDQLVLLTSVNIPRTYLDEIKLIANDLFQPTATATSSGLSLTWKGEQPLEKKRFLMFEIPFKGYFTAQSAPFKVNISATAMVEPTTWRFPWSMFSSRQKKVNFTRLIQWRQNSPDGSGAGFRLGPREGCFVFGEAAKEAVHVNTPKFDLLVTEVFENNEYKTSWVRDNNNEE
jgi:hypothetical protein